MSGAIHLFAPQTIKGRIELPASKSIYNRVQIISALAGIQEKTVPFSFCTDTYVLWKALRESSTTIDIGATGTAMRFLTAYLSTKQGAIHTLTGNKRMKERPIKILVDALRKLGASITYLEKEGYPPLKIEGKKLEGGHLTIVGNISSQYISALLLIAPYLEKGLTIELTGEISSKSYIEMTKKLMQAYGASVIWIDEQTLEVKKGRYEASPTIIEADWSNASYWYSMVALGETEKLLLPHLLQESLQGDSIVSSLFVPLGVKTTYHTEGVVLEKQERHIDHLTYDFSSHPDLIQTFVVCCALLGIPFCFYGIKSLRIKETDRILALCTEMKKLGFELYISPNDEYLSWSGKRVEKHLSPIIDTYGDHRMAMAFAPAVFVEKTLYINEPEVVEKSYPTFWDNLSHFVQISSV